MSNKINRKDFLSLTAIAGAASVVSLSPILSACTAAPAAKEVAGKPLKNAGGYIPNLTDKAADGKALKAGLIGCGGRGSGAIADFLRAADNVTITAICDVLPDKVENVRKQLKEKHNIELADENCFVGFDGYQKVIDSGVDVVLCCTPPVFRPEHFRYATEKGVHSFLEKPIAVDSEGYRSCMVTAKQARAKGLSVITGTQRHHQRPYVDSYKKIVEEGLMGEITGGTVYWNGGMLWYKERQPGWSDMEAMVRDWVNWKWLSGDHIVEQHCHNIDVFLWFSGLKPVKATGFGSRQRRVTGDQYDNFSVDFECENGVHFHSMCRQIDGCSNNVSEFLQGTKGSWSSTDFAIRDLEGNILWQWDKEAAEKQFQQHNPYTLEHVNWINHIRSGEPLMQAEEMALSNLASIMGREAAYTGQTVTWDEISAASQGYLPEKLELGKMDMSKYTVAVAGSGK
ncbi:putative exo-alpha-sialidase [Mucinivorans hirudinis]|uniref:Putative exo-alpha-sialidase n=1 Tax=Mucinivorans hirudinis TaxID=1433126 RepID=A0A060R7I3_9BACT|nr:putative exo-alpha-sialidase [Mucinivorans hirudinis]